MMRFKSAFTLVEVNLAIFIMATGVLAMVSLYSLGFRESEQSRDDVAAAGYADAFFAPLVAGLSATNTTWSQWKNLGSSPTGDGSLVCDRVSPSQGWSAYVQAAGSTSSENFRVLAGCNSTADGVFNELMGAAKAPYSGTKPSGLPSDYYYALVATRRGATITLALRSSRRRDQLMSQPIYYTDIHFQGDPNQ